MVCEYRVCVPNVHSDLVVSHIDNLTFSDLIILPASRSCIVVRASVTAVHLLVPHQ
jgi:hypothetical protein